MTDVLISTLLYIYICIYIYIYIYIYRYILTTQLCDASGANWFSFFDEQAKVLLGTSADELYELRQNQGDEAYVINSVNYHWLSEGWLIDWLIEHV